MFHSGDSREFSRLFQLIRISLHSFSHGLFILTGMWPARFLTWYYFDTGSFISLLHVSWTLLIIMLGPRGYLQRFPILRSVDQQLYLIYNLYFPCLCNTNILIDSWLEHRHLWEAIILPCFTIIAHLLIFPFHWNIKTVVKWHF